MKNKFTNLDNLERFFTNEKKCLKHFETIRWGKTPACTSCGSVNPYKLKDGKNYKCRECKKFFNALTGTIFENTKIPLIKWFKAIYIFTSHKKGISSIQLGKDLGITQKSAWFMLGRLRELLIDKAPQLLYGQVEVDEVYIGGREKNKHQSPKAKQWREKHGKLPRIGKKAVNGTDAAVVIGLVQRDGKIVNKVIKDNTSNSIMPVVLSNVKEGASIYTDSHQSYANLKLNGFKHETVKHHKQEYVVGQAHTGSIDGYWSLLRRGITGIYHQVSPKHLQRYCNEFAFRYNTRKSTEVQRFDCALGQCEDSRLKYSELIKKGE